MADLTCGRLLVVGDEEAVTRVQGRRFPNAGHSRAVAGTQVDPKIVKVFIGLILENIVVAEG